ncbi:MAG TPA: putative metal-binding motif-containing protein, partial [Candidatus Polarisedimenticolia bacterium]|nr:putative metal-binding motif-containing protein [Candidatus Polarisedimenticolia bacterium]
YAGGTAPLSGSGGSYDPSTDTWSRISGRGAPTARKNHVALWTGDRMIVWGGSTDELARRPPADDGGMYDPVTDTWKSMSRVGAPEGRGGAIAVWTGSQMLVWGGGGGTRGAWQHLVSGGRYSPATDSWAPIAADGAPPGRSQGTGVFIGDGMLIWGGTAPDNGPAEGGAFYQSATPGDRDGDGYSRCRKEDCDDSDPATHRGAVEIRDGRDNDCDGRIAEDDVAPVPPPATVPVVPGGVRPYKVPDNLLEHFRARYEHVEADSVISSLKETPDGPIGHVSLRGRMTPDNIKPSTTRDEHARASAMAFLAQEAVLLDLPDLGELEERQFKWFRPEVAYIDYVRRIGGYELAGEYLHFEVEADGPVVDFSASLMPVGAGLYAAARGPFISMAQVIDIVQRDMGPMQDGTPVTVELKQRFALAQSQAIIQSAWAIVDPSQRCVYGLNARTGEIVQKDCNPGVASTGRAPR